MVRNRNESIDTQCDDTPKGAKGLASDGRQADDAVSAETPSRLSAAIMRILASARGATEGRRAVTSADLSPSRNSTDSSRSPEPERREGEEASRMEWTLRMMQ